MKNTLSLGDADHPITVTLSATEAPFGMVLSDAHRIAFVVIAAVARLRLLSPVIEQDYGQQDDMDVPRARVGKATRRVAGSWHVSHGSVAGLKRLGLVSTLPRVMNRVHLYDYAVLTEKGHDLAKRWGADVAAVVAIDGARSGAHAVSAPRPAPTAATPERPTAASGARDIDAVVAGARALIASTDDGNDPKTRCTATTPSARGLALAVVALHDQLDAAWHAVPFRGAVRGLVSLDEIVADCFRERDDLRAVADDLGRRLGVVAAVASGLMLPTQLRSEKAAAGRPEGSLAIELRGAAGSDEWSVTLWSRRLHRNGLAWRDAHPGEDVVLCPHFEPFPEAPASVTEAWLRSHTVTLTEALRFCGAVVA